MIMPELIKTVSYGRTNIKSKKYEDKVSLQVEEFEGQIKQFLELVKTHGDESLCREATDNIVALISKFNESLMNDRKSTNFLDMKSVKVIKDIKYSRYDNTFSHNFYSPEILKAPRANIKDITEIAEKLGLLIIPTQYVNKKLIEKDRYTAISGYTRYVSTAYDRFISAADANNLNAWLLCPVQYYDIEEHSKNLKFDFFVPSSVQQAFTSIKIILPMLIGMISQIKNLSKKVDNMSTELNTIQNTLIQQQQQINRLEEELTQQRIKIAEQAAQEQQLLQELQEARERIQWQIMDPMLFAIPADITNINSYTGNAALGPAWGPEIDEVLVKLLGLTKQTEYKNYFSTESDRY